MPRYEPKRIEAKWQAYWDEHDTFVTSNTPDPNAKGKLYALDMFPYPSGSGLHVGHPEGYTATDIMSRYARMCGKHVLHPMGWDAFGLPAEQHAMDTGTHPRETTYKNIATFKRQLKMLGFSYDWSRELSTTDEDYYKWTQWIFLQLFDTWFDSDYEWTGPDGVKRIGKGRPISELPIPVDVIEWATNNSPSPRGEGWGEGDESREDAIRAYQDSHRLAYQSEAPVNWCPALGTVLANEEVNAEGKSDRGNHPVERRALRQWMLGITRYSERLIDELEPLDWPESVKILQRNWIGKSTGAEIDFFVAEGRKSSGESSSESFAEWKASRKKNGFIVSPEPNIIRVYTTRPDTLFGATYMVLSPEHPLVDSITTAEQRDKVEEYRRLAGLKSDLDRTDLAKGKSGVFTGAYAINPVNEESIPIWIADYVLSSYGTGAIMAVPAHDERDLEFARTFDLNVIEVVDSGSEEVNNIGFTGEGTAINSGAYNGTPTAVFKQIISEELNAAGLGKLAVNYRLRDWLFSRQRYWGEPFPIWHELDVAGKPNGKIRAVAESELPVTLPDMDDFKPKGTPDPPLSWAPDAWLYKTAEDGTKLKRETNSMPQWAGSCWYYLRFADNKNSDAFINPELEKYWLPVDLYIGGAEHAVLHLLYSRFWHKVLFDRGLVSTPEPFQKLVNQGMILGEAELTGFVKEGTEEFVSARDVKDNLIKGTDQVVTPVTVNVEDVDKKGELLVLKSDPNIVVETRAHKMSKSRGNVVNPDDVVNEYGADSLRLYEMFMGPLEQTKPWSMKGVEGVYRFLGRAWRMVVDDAAEEITLHEGVQDVQGTEEQERMLHKTIKHVTEDIEKISGNTAISRMMEFVNFFTNCDVRPKAAMEAFTLLLAPFAPHLAEELWEALGHYATLTYHPWPTFDEAKIVEATIEIPVQINGKLKAKIHMPTDADQATMQQLAETDANIKEQLTGKNVVKVICVPKRMVNFVIQ